MTGLVLGKSLVRGIGKFLGCIFCIGKNIEEPALNFQSMGLRGVITTEFGTAKKSCILRWLSREPKQRGKLMVKDAIGMLFVTAFVITFFTNAITTEYNVWALMVKFGGQ